MATADRSSARSTRPVVVKGNINIGFIYYPRFDRAHPRPWHVAAAGGWSRLFHEGHGGRIPRYLWFIARASRCFDHRQARQRAVGRGQCHAIQTGDPVDPEGLKDCGRQLGNLARAMVDVTVRGRGEHGGVVLENRDIRAMVNA